MKKMIRALVWLFLCFFPLIDAKTKNETVSAMQGGYFTLRTGHKIQSKDTVEWRRRLGSTRTLIGKLEKGNISNSTICRDRLHIDRQTGDLTITNITNKHTGVYELSIDFVENEWQTNFFVTVYAPVPVPVITRYSPQCSSSSSESKIVLLCSVVNVSHVTVSWYKGKGLLSTINEPDFRLGLSLPLEVEYQDRNTYSCVVNNPVSTQTKHLDTYQLCQTCSGCDYWRQTTEAVIRLVVSAVVGVAAVAAVVVLVYDIRSRRIELERKTKFIK